MICNDHSLRHDARDIQLCVVGRFPRVHHAALCAGCREALEELGLDIQIERRADPARPDRGSFSLGPILRRLVA